MYRLSDKAVLFAPPHTIEPGALKQIENTASMPFIFKHVAVMPDCHYGKELMCNLRPLMRNFQ